MLELFSDKIPSPTRDEMMDMLVRALSKVNEELDTKKAFKRLFVTNALDGSEDHLVSEKLFNLVGNEMLKFREDLCKEKAPKDLADLLKTITPPKGIRRKNVEGTELFDCEGAEIETSVDDEKVEEGEFLL